MDGNGNNDKDHSGNNQTHDGKWGSSPNKLVSKEMQDALKLRRDEQNLFARFKNAAIHALEKTSREDEENEGGINNLRMGMEESRIVRNLNGVGMLEGLAAGILTFFVLRRGPVYVGRWVRRRQMAQYQHHQQSPSSSSLQPPPSGSGYRFSDPNATTTNPFHRSFNPAQEFPRSGSFVVRSIWFMFDVTLSLMMAASTSMAYTDTDKIRQQVIDMPLIQGTSLTSEALCDPIVRELAKTRQEHDPTFERLHKLNKTGCPTPASIYLNNIIHFAENCERRLFMERKIREERGLLATDKVEIPVPGVPRDGPRLVVTDADGIEKLVYDDGTVEPFSDSQFQDNMSWVSDFDSNDKNL
jgi:hypothetical protein